MRIEPTIIDGCFVVELTPIGDGRGVFLETYREDVFASYGIHTRFVQTNQSMSRQHVLRGLHFQRPPKAQSKLVRVVQGEIWDVMVDLRPDSPTYKQWVGLTLSDQNHRMALIHEGCAHGFLVMSERAIVTYACSDSYSPEHEDGVRWDDPELAIAWPIPNGVVPIVSTKDNALGGSLV